MRENEKSSGFMFITNKDLSQELTDFYVVTWTRWT